MLKQINKTLKFFKSPLVQLNQVNELVNLCVAALKLQENLKKRTMNDYEDVQEDCDEDQKEGFKGEYESYNDLMQIVMEISGNLMKIYKEKSDNLIFTNIIPYYYKSLSSPEATDNELLYAICAFDDLLENCSEEIYNKSIVDILNHFFNILCKTKNIDLIQSIIYGFGVFSKRTSQELFNQFYFPISKVIFKLILKKTLFIRLFLQLLKILKLLPLRESFALNARLEHLENWHSIKIQVM